MCAAHSDFKEKTFLLFGVATLLEYKENEHNNKIIKALVCTYGVKWIFKKKMN